MEGLGGRAVCVIGFPRSGTSLTARILRSLGVELGAEQDLLEAAETDNPRGYWEPRWMIELNDRILDMLGCKWWQPLPAEPEWPRRPEMEPLREEARTLLEDKFGGVAIWGWKDPRTTLTLPFWRELVPDLSYVVALRNPVDAVASLQRRPEPTLSVRAWGELWLEYTARALMETAGGRRHLVFYEDFFGDATAEIERLASFVGVQAAGRQELVATAGATIAGDLRHHRTSALELAADPGTPAEARSLFLALRAAADLDRVRQDTRVTPTIVEAIQRVAPELWWVNRLAAQASAAAAAAAREAERLRGESAEHQARADRLAAELERERLIAAERGGSGGEKSWSSIAASIRRARSYAARRRG